MRVDFISSPNKSTMASTMSMSPADMVQSAADIICTDESADVQLTPGIRKAMML